MLLVRVEENSKNEWRKFVNFVNVNVRDRTKSYMCTFVVQTVHQLHTRTHRRGAMRRYGVKRSAEVV